MAIVRQIVGNISKPRFARKIIYHFSQPGRRMKRQEQMLESLHALKIDTGDTLEAPNYSIEVVENERLGV